MNSLLYKITAFYISHFKFPNRGEKYFSKFLKRNALISRSFRKKLHNGLFINVKPDDHIQRIILWYGYYEKENILFWEKLINPDSVVIDIGANIGYYTLIAAKKASEGHVHSFEPVTFNYDALQKNIKLNNLKNITANNAGISTKEGLDMYYISSKENIGMSGLKPAENFSGKMEEKTTLTLDNYVAINNLTKIDFIKIDIEGNELNALRGMQNVLQKNHPVLFIELLNEHLTKFDTTVKDVYGYLSLFNYKGYTISKENNLNPVTDNTEDRMIIFSTNELK